MRIKEVREVTWVPVMLACAYCIVMTFVIALWTSSREEQAFRRGRAQGIEEMLATTNSMADSFNKMKAINTQNYNNLVMCMTALKELSGSISRSRDEGSGSYGILEGK